MKATVDPRLEQIIDEARDEDEVEAFVILDQAAAASAESDERGVGGVVIDRVVQEVHQEPSQVRFLPKLGVVYVKGSRRLVRQLLEADEVQSASSAEAEFVVPES